MSIAGIFALLLAAGVCAQTEFRGADGSRLAVLVCPVMMAAEELPEGEVPEMEVPKMQVPVPGEKRV